MTTFKGMMGMLFPSVRSQGPPPDLPPEGPYAGASPSLRPTYSVSVGGEDLTDRIEMDSLLRAMSERGESVCTFSIPLAGENEVASNALVRDAPVLVSCEGREPWAYHVVNVSMPQPDEPVIEVECAGGWDVLHQREDYMKGFVETRYEKVVVYPSNYQPPPGGTPIDTLTVDLEGQINVVLPMGTEIKSQQGISLYLLPFDGLSDGYFNIKRVTGQFTCAGTGLGEDLGCVIGGYAWNDPFSMSWVADVAIGAAYSGASGPFPGDTLPDGVTTLVFCYYPVIDVPARATDEYVQIRDLTVYIDRTSAPTIDSAVAEIWHDVTGLTGVTSTVGPPLKQCMIDPFTTPADAIQQILTKADVPPLCGVIHGTFYCKPRPAAPTDLSRLWVVSDEITPGLQWDVKPDTAQSKDYVCLTYSRIITGPSGAPSGLPAKVYYPSQPSGGTARVALIESGTELTDAEATAAAKQAYSYYHNFVQGQVTIPYVCQNGSGQDSPCDHIEAWDWVYNVGKANSAEAGPFLISEVSHQGGIATLTIGATEGYSYESPYRLPAKGRYVGAHKTRSREPYRKWWRRTHRKKPLPKKHPKWHYGPWRDVEGRYV